MNNFFKCPGRLWYCLAKDNYGRAFRSPRDMGWPKLLLLLLMGLLLFSFSFSFFFCLSFGYFGWFSLFLQVLTPPSAFLLLLEIIACPFRTKDIGPYGAWTMALLWFFMPKERASGGGNWKDLLAGTVTATVDFGAMFCHLPTGI